MSKWEMVRLGSLNHYQSKTVNPMREPDRRFELFSVPSYDSNHPEIVTGAEIGSSKQIVEEGDVLLCKINPRINRVWAVTRHTDHQLIASSEWIVIRNRDIHPNYLVWCLRSNYFCALMTNNVTGIGGSLTRAQPKLVSQYLVPFPPLEIQKRIAQILDTAAELLAMHKQQLVELDRLTKAIFFEMFGDPVANEKGWGTGKIKDLATRIQYGTSEKASTERLSFPVLRMNNITYEGDMDLSDLKYIDLSEDDQKKYLVHKGEMLFNRTNSKELVGKTAVYRGDEPMAFAGYLVKLVPNERANSEFISAYLNSPYGKKLLYKMAKNIVGMANINAQELGNIDIYIPPIQLQTRFAEIVTKIEEQKALVKKAIDETQCLFDSLMSQYFE